MGAGVVDVDLLAPARSKSSTLKRVLYFLWQLKSKASVNFGITNSQLKSNLSELNIIAE